MSPPSPTFSVAQLQGGSEDGLIVPLPMNCLPDALPLCLELNGRLYYPDGRLKSGMPRYSLQGREIRHLTKGSLL
jgi:hypothetical protein